MNVLPKGIGEVDHRLRRVVAKRLRSLGVVESPELIALCADGQKSFKVRSEAAELLGLLSVMGRLTVRQRRDAARVLLPLLKEPHRNLVWSAAASLAQIGFSKIIGSLLRVVQSSLPDESRRAAVYVLGFIPDGQGINVLVSIIEDKEETPALRGEAAEALAFCGRKSHRAFAALVRGLKDGSAEVRFFSAYALGVIGNSRARQALESVLADRAIAPGHGPVAREAQKSLLLLKR